MIVLILNVTALPSHACSNFIVCFACRFTNQKGESLERLLGVKHVLDTTSASLKRSLDAMFVKHNLSMSRLRGQGYDGASNTRGELNGLKKLVLDVNPHAFLCALFCPPTSIGGCCCCQRSSSSW